MGKWEGGGGSRGGGGGFQVMAICGCNIHSGGEQGDACRGEHLRLPDAYPLPPRNEVREGIIYYWNHLVRMSVHPAVRVSGFCSGIF